MRYKYTLNTRIRQYVEWQLEHYHDDKHQFEAFKTEVDPDTLKSVEACMDGLVLRSKRAIEELQAENKQLREQLNMAITLPCNVGDTVYFMVGDETKSAELLAMKVNISGDGSVTFEGYFQLGAYIKCWVIGESLFATEEQAKQAYIGKRERGEEKKT